MDKQKQWLADNAKKDGVITTPSGLQYKVIREGDGPKPQSRNDEVEAHYKGTLIDGSKFDSSYDRDDPLVFFVNGVIEGWQEGIMLMSVGAKYEFYIPSELGYGVRGAGNVIPPNATLIFEVELLKIY